MRDWRRIVSDDLASSSAPPRARARIGQAWADNGGEERQNFTPSWVEDLGGFLSIPEVDIVDENHFMEAFVNRSRPAVIKVIHVCARFDGRLGCCKMGFRVSSRLIRRWTRWKFDLCSVRW